MFPLLRAGLRGALRTVGVLPRRPLGVTLLSLGFLLAGLFLALVGLVAIGLVLVSGGGGSGQVVEGLLTLARGALFAVAAFGLWDMRKWGWWMGLALAVVGLYLALGNVFWTLLWACVGIYLLLVYTSFDTFWMRARRAMAH